MNVAIVGSRSFPQLKMVEWFVRDLPKGVTVVSGGAKGVDTAAVEAAKKYGLPYREHLPDLEGCKERYEYAKRYFERNQRIVDDADLVVAFSEKDKGGTWDTVKRAKKAGKPVKIIRPSLFFPGESDKENEELNEDEMYVSPQQAGRAKNKGKGPFAIKRVSLGSYALRRYAYIEPEEWAEIVADKDSNPRKLADKMTPAFLNFFEKYNKLGYVHAITVPPRSVRNLDKPHVMDMVAEAVAQELGVPFVRLFKPWEKSTRGRFAKKGKIEITDEVKKMPGKVVWVLDDVTTTNYTLRAAVQGLMALEIHAHGLVYIVMA